MTICNPPFTGKLKYFLGYYSLNCESTIFSILHNNLINHFQAYWLSAICQGESSVDIIIKPIPSYFDFLLFYEIKENLRAIYFSFVRLVCI